LHFFCLRKNNTAGRERGGHEYVTAAAFGSEGSGNERSRDKFFSTADSDDTSDTRYAVLYARFIPREPFSLEFLFFPALRRGNIRRTLLIEKKRTREL